PESDRYVVRRLCSLAALEVALKERPMGLRNWRRQGRAAAIKCRGRGHAGETHLGLALFGLATKFGVDVFAELVFLGLDHLLPQHLREGLEVDLPLSALVASGAGFGVAAHGAAS